MKKFLLNNKFVFIVIIPLIIFDIGFLLYDSYLEDHADNIIRSNVIEVNDNTIKVEYKYVNGDLAYRELKKPLFKKVQKYDLIFLEEKDGDVKIIMNPSTPANVGGIGVLITIIIATIYIAIRKCKRNG